MSQIGLEKKKPTECELEEKKTHRLLRRRAYVSTKETREKESGGGPRGDPKGEEGFGCASIDSNEQPKKGQSTQ